MADTSETEWKRALTAILEDLEKDQYRKLSSMLHKIPACNQTNKRERFAQIIIQYYGFEGSVAVVDEAMYKLPRRDHNVQSRLLPFVEKLKADQEGNKSKRKAFDPQTEEETARVDKMMKLDPKTNEQTETGSAVPVGESTMADNPTTETSSWRKSIHDLKESKEIVLKDTIGGKVIHKSALHTSKTQKSFFNVLVTDETAGLYLMVYGKPHYQEIEEGKYYSFRKLIRDEAGHVKVTPEAVVAEIANFEIPEKVEKKASHLLSKSPIISIEHFKTLKSGTGSVTASVIEINPIKNVPLKNKKKTERRQSFHIKDETDSIEVVFGGEKIQQCKNMSVGDVIVLNNVKVTRDNKTVSLHSTSTSDIIQVYKVGIREKRTEIVGVTKVQKRQTHLEVMVDQNIQTLMVASKHLAEVFGLTPGEHFKTQLVSALPVLAEALIEGNEIKKLTYIQQETPATQMLDKQV